jgi:hypothetical protein
VCTAWDVCQVCKGNKLPASSSLPLAALRFRARGLRGGFPAGATSSAGAASASLSPAAAASTVFFFLHGRMTCAVIWRMSAAVLRWALADSTVSSGGHHCASSPALQGANMPDPDRHRGSELPSSINRRNAGAAAPDVPLDVQTAAAWAPLTSGARRAWAAPAAAPAGRAPPPPRPSKSPASGPLRPPPSCGPRNQGFRVVSRTTRISVRL